MTYLEPPHLGNLSTDSDFTRDSSGDESGTVFFEPLDMYTDFEDESVDLGSFMVKVLDNGELFGNGRDKAPCVHQQLMLDALHRRSFFPRLYKPMVLVF